MTDKLHATGLVDQGTYDPNDRLLAGEGPLKAEKHTLVTDAAHDLKRGCLLGYLTASDKVTLYDAGGAGGAEVAYGVLANDTDATAADAECMVYVEGLLSSNEIIAQTSGLASVSMTLKNDLRAKGIFLNTTLAA